MKIFLSFVKKGRWLSGFSKMHFSQRKVIWINNDITGGKLIPWVIQKARLDWMLLSVLWIMYISIRKFLLMAWIHFPFHNLLSLFYSRTTFVILSSIALTVRSTGTLLFSQNYFSLEKCCFSIWGHFTVKKIFRKLSKDFGFWYFLWSKPDF